MSKRSLSVEQIELLHHIELSEAGWQERVVDQFVLSACLDAATGLTDAEIQAGLFGVIDVVGAEQIRRSIQRLVSAKRLVELI